MRSSILLPLLLAGCAADTSRSADAREDPLTRELAGRTAGPAQTCVPVTQGAGSLTAVDDRTITYRTGGTMWVNRLPARCPGLRPFSTIIVEVYGSQYCRKDRIRALQPNDIIPGPICFLGDFTPYKAAAR